jgi:transcriptional regulator with XRE-family HTH domain
MDKAIKAKQSIVAGTFADLAASLHDQPDYAEHRQAADAELTAELVAYSLGTLRSELDVTQAVLAERLGVTQPNVSMLERQDDMRLSTLRNIVDALGGELEIIVKFGGSEGTRAIQLRLDEALAATKEAPPAARRGPGPATGARSAKAPGRPKARKRPAVP